MRWVADASVVVAYLLGAGSEQEREAILEGAHAPALLDVETTQTLRGLVRGGKIELASAELARTELAQLTLRRYPDAPSYGAAGSCATCARSTTRFTSHWRRGSMRR